MERHRLTGLRPRLHAIPNQSHFSLRAYLQDLLGVSAVQPRPLNVWRTQPELHASLIFFFKRRSPFRVSLAHGGAEGMFAVHMLIQGTEEELEWICAAGNWIRSDGILFHRHYEWERA